jgi:putative ABC transport system permease protein
MASLALQAVLMALVAVLVAVGLQLLVAPAFPLEVRVPRRAFWQIPMLAVVVALLAGAAGMRRVARSDPALAFAGGA